MEKERIIELRRLINYHNHLYYRKSTNEITDFEYDKLIKELEMLENKNPHLITYDSPTQIVGY